MRNRSALRQKEEEVWRRCGCWKMKKLKIQVSDDGAELCSVYDKVRGREALWTADPKYWARHAPVLFPFVGKVNGGHLYI